jgi:putative transposase
MPQYRRACVPGGTFFFTVVTFERRRILTSDLARRCLRKAWEDTNHRRPFELQAVCLLPDHLHCVWSLPEADGDFSSRWKMIKGCFTRMYRAAGGAEGDRCPSRELKGEAAVWQRRFWEHWIRDVEDFQRHVDYIHFNPVKHGLVERPGDWPWSSFRSHVREGWYHPDWGAQEPESLSGFTARE